jgi:predicted Abi (CAAX) family protease
MIFILASQGKDIQEQAIRKARMVVSHFSFCLKRVVRKPFLR